MTRDLTVSWVKGALAHALAWQREAQETYEGFLAAENARDADLPDPIDGPDLSPITDRTPEHWAAIKDACDSETLVAELGEMIASYHRA